MNLLTQGVDPGLDLRDINALVRLAEESTQLPVHPRHPYAGELVFTAFSGSHQDAIRKGMAHVRADHWEVPYLPIDPADVGSSYKETVRVNSQSGKGGVGFILEEFFGVSLPRPMLMEFSKLVPGIPRRPQSSPQPGLTVIQEKARKAILDIARTDKFDLIVEQAVYFNPKIDITDRVMKSLGDK